MNTGLTLRDKQIKAQKAVEKEHDELVNIVASATSADGTDRTDGRLVAALKAQQTTWSKYKVDECELVGTLTGAGGSWPSTYATKCEANLTEQRLVRIRSATKCIQKIQKDKRLYEQSSCLEQLAPLVNGR
ncbi:MAG: lysozyme inhibitor LprI family protein [Rhodoferax sp.]